MASRRKSRISAFQALYFWDVTKAPLEELVSFAWLEEKKINLYKENGTYDFAVLLVAGTLENINEIDKTIKEHLQHWEIDRLNRVDLAVLRLSVYSLMYQHEIPPSIVIDEAIGICREYGTDDSYKFVNGVLDSIRKSLTAKEPV
jgi:N utilization substance protein B